jgi:hypothetical protein
MRKSLVAAAALILGLAGAALPATAAEARTKFVDGIGLITGYYHPSGTDYTGLKQPSHDHCVHVERKTSGVWQIQGVTGYRDCDASTSSSWAIYDVYARNTDAIRLRRVGTTWTVTLCSTKSDCQSM